MTGSNKVTLTLNDVRKLDLRQKNKAPKASREK